MSKGSAQNWVRTAMDLDVRPVDPVTVQSHIRLEKKKFYGAFRVDDDGYWHISTKPSEPRYVGRPSRELDNNWVRLVTRTQIPVSIQCLND
jgi:hypothetical protein